MRCLICSWPSTDKLCNRHSEEYIWDCKLKGFRLKKKNRGCRYTQSEFHATETKLVKILEDIFGKNNVVTSFRPEWALSDKHVLYEYDIHIVGTNIFIEYDGKQHYEYVPFFHKNQEQFAKQQLRDAHKRALAIEHGYKVITFSYKEPILNSYVKSKVKMESRK